MIARSTGRPEHGARANLMRVVHDAEAPKRRRAALLLLPVIAFLTVTYVFPIAMVLGNAAYDPTIRDTFPESAEAIRSWSGEGLPEPAVFETFAQELAAAHAEKSLGAAARQLNIVMPGARTVVTGTARNLAKGFEPNGRDTLIDLDKQWGDREIWLALREAAPALTPRYLLTAVDLERAPDGLRRNEDGVFLTILGRSLTISVVVTAICLLIGFPVAHMIASASGRWKSTLLLLVLVPFWTSLLVRTSAWIVLLQTNGVINDALVALGLFTAPMELIYNRTGVYVAMVHILLPFMILPIYSVMLSIPRDYFRAALSLGAHPLRAFLRVYMPQTFPGIAAGTLMVFVLALGYYITPALVGGADDQMISYFIAFYTNRTLNWGLAAALAAILLASVIAIFAALYKLLSGPNERLM